MSQLKKKPSHHAPSTPLRSVHAHAPHFGGSKKSKSKSRKSKRRGSKSRSKRSVRR